jgi:hypothetical protein
MLRDFAGLAISGRLETCYLDSGSSFRLDSLLSPE